MEKEENQNNDSIDQNQDTEIITEKPEDVFAWFERWDIESNLMKKYVKFMLIQ